MKVAIFFGSKSDSETMKKSADVLREFGVDFKAYIISAHRAGALLTKTLKQVEADGCEVIIAGAGLAAALPGVIAGQTVLPVVGVPLECIRERVDAPPRLVDVGVVDEAVPVVILAVLRLVSAELLIPAEPVEIAAVGASFAERRLFWQRNRAKRRKQKG